MEKQEKGGEEGLCVFQPRNDTNKIYVEKVGLALFIFTPSYFKLKKASDL